jgi:hypothetical protein
VEDPTAFAEDGTVATMIGIARDPKLKVIFLDRPSTGPSGSMVAARILRQDDILSGAGFGSS